MGPEGIMLVNPPITTLQQSLTHSELCLICFIYTYYYSPIFIPLFSPSKTTLPKFWLNLWTYLVNCLEGRRFGANEFVAPSLSLW